MNTQAKEQFEAWMQRSGGPVVVAGMLGCSVSLVRHWLNGIRFVTPAWAVQIERVSGGRILRQTLCPRIYDDMRAAE